MLQCDELVEHGATVGETPAAVIKKCKYTIAMLSDPAAALSVSYALLSGVITISYVLTKVEILV